MYVYCVYHAMSKKSENWSNCKQKGQKQASFLAFHKCCQGCPLRGPRNILPVSYLSAPSAVHRYRVPGKFIRRLKSLFG